MPTTDPLPAALTSLGPSFGPHSCLRLRNLTFQPALFCAPMAGLTHSPFRRLVADFGGYGALFTEMLCARWLQREDVLRSPAVRRRPAEGTVLYQLMVSDPADLPAALDRLRLVQPAGIDLNCACPAPKIRHTGAGSDLFEDRDRLAVILAALRRHFTGVLTVKCRLGTPRPDWQERLQDRLRLFEDVGVDALILHPRFSDEKMKRRARHELLPQVAASTRLPLIASGDLHDRTVVDRHPEYFHPVAGIMIGRMAVVQPWVFLRWNGPTPTVDFLELWNRFATYACEDFPPERAFYRIRAFTLYYARNFRFGHTLFAAAQSAPGLEALRERAARFLGAGPPTLRHPGVEGLA